MEGPAPEEFKMNIDEDFLQFKKENEKDDLGKLKYVEQQNSERNNKNALMRLDDQIDKKEFTAILRVPAKEIKKKKKCKISKRA